MKIKFSNLKEFIKKRKKLVVLSTLALVIILLIGGKIVSAKNQKPNFEYFIVTKGNVEQEVTATGKVKPAEGLDYAFEMGGKVASVKVKVGDKVKSGQTLALLKNNDMSSSVAQASAGVDSARSAVAQYEAGVASQKARLEELKKGARPEELAMAQLQLDNAKQALESTKSKVVTDTTQALVDGANSASSAISSGLNTLNVITDIQYAHFVAYDQESNALTESKVAAVNSLVGGVDGGRWIFQYINDMKGGARGSVITAQNNPTEANVVKALSDTSSALMKISQTLDAIPFNSASLSASEKAGITTERSMINSQISLISNKISSLNSLASTNQNLINNAQNAVSLAEQELNLKKAGATTEAVQIQEAAVKQAEASLASAQAQVRSAQASLGLASAQYSKSIITSTVNGVVTKVEIKVGEMAGATAPAISVMTEAKFGVEANIPEADISKIKIDNSAEITLDAYGSDVKFEAKVVRIDPAETVIDGVSTYKTSFEFIKEDERVKSGMTANITVKSGSREGALVIPQRYIIKKNGISNVLITEDQKTTKELRVETGLVGSDGNVEVIFGVMEGERIINPSSVKK
ncbi:MAG: efflux RND transporter periplasmic adaptor subunit [Patescibacteria group bacterium]|nr:efflux RND transporter periplasmic adaptor subunit [Patescibacteria group bacterium]